MKARAILRDLIYVVAALLLLAALVVVWSMRRFLGYADTELTSLVDKITADLERRAKP